MRDKKTGLERTAELKGDMQGKKQQELRNIRAELQRLEGSSSRLQELENELAKVVGVHTRAVMRWFAFPKGESAYVGMLFICSVVFLIVTLFPVG